MTAIPTILSRASGFEQQDVCPHCHCPLMTHHFRTGAFINTTYHCHQHGDVAPRHLTVKERPDWSAA